MIIYTYNDYISLIHLGFATLTATGLTDVISINWQLEDLIETEFNPYPGTLQAGKTVWLCPIPMTVDNTNSNTYSIRIYVVQQIKDDSSDRFSAFSSCIELVNKLIQWLPINITGIVYPINITPVVLFDAQVDGIYFDLSCKINSIYCYTEPVNI